VLVLRMMVAGVVVIVRVIMTSDFGLRTSAYPVLMLMLVRVRV
jgi:hypothetical protein